MNELEGAADRRHQPWNDQRAFSKNHDIDPVGEECDRDCSLGQKVQPVAEISGRYRSRLAYVIGGIRLCCHLPLLKAPSPLHVLFCIPIALQRKLSPLRRQQ